MIIAGWVLEEIDQNTTKVSSFAVNDLKGSIPKFVINAGSSNHSSIFTNLKKTICEIEKKEALPEIKRRKESVEVSAFDV
mmetsp:Transcript_14993/g.13160  ORF Transcript_14993/g.13160 Transcript_14993/m.13160 type:complete len:80 (+) Transcript_14993:150-389(+)